MKMTVVRTCLLVMVLFALSTTTGFGQIIYNVGAPAGTPYNGTSNFNFAVNREGNAELFAPVTICAPTYVAANAGVVVPGATAQFDVGDVYTVTFTGTLGSNSPTLKTLGTLGGNNIQVTQATAGGAVVFSATAAMIQPPAVGGATPGLPVATVTLNVTTSPTAASGVNCVTIQNLRFDLGNTNVGAIAGPPADSTTYGVTVTQIQEGVGGAAISAAVALPGVGTNAGNPVAPLGNGMPAVGTVGVALTAGVATAKTTLGTVGAAGIANPTGYTTGGAAINTTNAGINAGGAAAANPNNIAVGGIAATMGTITQNSGGTATGTVSIQQNPIAILTTGAGSVSTNGPFLPVAAGGGLFRGFTASGPDTTTFLNSSGATTGTQIQLNISGVPAGVTATFPATISSSSGLVVWNMALVGSGSISSPGGTVTYATTINEGTPYSLNGTAGVGPSIDISYTLTEAASGGASGTTKLIIQVGPTSAQGGIPSYSAVNGASVLPSQVVSNVGQWTLFRVGPNTSTRTYPYVLVAGAAGQPSSYDTGIVLENTGRGVSSSGAISNSGQDGTFTIYYITTSATVYSIASTSANIPNASSLGAGGVLTQGSVWQALASEIEKAVGLSGDWKGYVTIQCQFPNSAGFAFISQFANPGGGATMGYIAQ